MLKRIGLLASALLLTLNCAFLPLFADGGKAKNMVLDADVSFNEGRLSFHVDSSPIIFYLGTVRNKYHVLLIRVKNGGKAPLQLSQDQDSIEFRYSGDRRVKGLLNLPTADPGTWDALDPEIRTAVAYPQSVPAGEEEGIYVFVPVDDVKEQRKNHAVPFSIVYTIRSLPQPVIITTRAAGA